MNPRDPATVRRLFALALVAVAAMVFSARAHAAPPRCKIGPLERCLVKAMNISLERAGVSTRATSASCNRAQTRCELVFSGGAFCATARIQVIAGGKWWARISDPHDCRRERRPSAL